jgi:RHS repeat-associated protein
LIAIYEYNGLNQRIKKTVGSTVTKSFFNENWQEIESQTGSEITSYVWGLRYIDDLILREKGTERLYSLADPNWNVVGVCDANGDVVERMKYDAFGKITWSDANFITKNGSDYNWNRTFTGQVLDAETGLILYRNRYYSTEMGRFVNRDPIAYEAGDINIYRYIFNRCGSSFDPFGLQIESIFGKPDDYYEHQLPPVPPPQPTPPPPMPSQYTCTRIAASCGRFVLKCCKVIGKNGNIVLMVCEQTFFTNTPLGVGSEILPPPLPPPPQDKCCPESQ